MTNGRRTCRRQLESLPELMLVGALSLMLVGVAIQLFHSAWEYSRSCRSEAFCRREIAILARAWRKHVQTVGSPSASVRTKCGFLILASDDGERSLRLPGGAVAAVAVEAPPEERPFHVLILTWPQKRLSKTYTCTARIVACSGKT